MKASHLGPEGEPRIVDVGDKPVRPRRAVAQATVQMRPEVLAELLASGGPKGDAMVTARLAGIGAAKRTPELIPLCHPLPLDNVEVSMEPDPARGRVIIQAEVRATARTGVEMEALTAASVAALTLYDMAKALQRDIIIQRVELLEKEGGRSGRWSRGEVQAGGEPTSHEAVVVTCSNRSASGERADASGPALVDALRAAGWDVAPEAHIVPDERAIIASTLVRLTGEGYRLIVTTGGTGLSPTDVTPAATRDVIERDVPGLAELMRAAGAASTPMAALSRGVVGSRGTTLIANLPGSPRGATESLAALLPVLRHAMDQLSGADH